MNKVINKTNLIYVIPIIIIAIGIIMRIWGLDWGMPYFLHPDEKTIVNTAVDMAKRGSFEPNVFYRPDHLDIKINMIAYSVISRMIYNSSVEAVYQQNPQLIYVIARGITASFGIGQIFIAYLIGKKMSPSIGIIIACLVAIFPSFILHSHYVTPDIPITFFVFLTIYFSMKYIDEVSRKNLLYICLVVAAGITMKYTMAIGCVLIAIVVMKKDNEAGKLNIRSILYQGFIAAGAVIGFIFLISPVLITNIGAVYNAIQNEARSTHLGADNLGYFGNISYYFTQYLLQTKIILLIPCVIGMHVMIQKYRKYSFPILFGAIYWLILGKVALHWERWALPMYITPILLTGIGIDGIHTIWKKSKMKYNRLILNVGMIILMFISSLSIILEMVKVQLDFVLPNTRVVSVEYCENNNITKDNSIYEGYTTLEKTNPKSIFNEFSITNGDLLVNKPNAEYIILSSEMYERYLNEKYRYANECNIYNLLDAQYEIINEYIPIKKPISKFATKSIVYDAKYVLQTLRKGYVGDELKFYKIETNQHKEY